MLDGENGATGKENLISVENGLTAFVSDARDDVKDYSTRSTRKASENASTIKQPAANVSLFSSDDALPQCSVVRKFRVLKGEVGA